MIPAPLPEDDSQRLAELYALGLLDTDADPAFDRVTRLAQRLFSVPMVLVSLIDRDRQWFKSNVGVDAEETPRNISFCGHAITGRDVFVVENALEDERFHDNPLVADDPHIRFYAGAPLRTPGGAAIGTLCLIDREPRSLSTPELETLRDLAAIIEAEISQMCVANTDALTGLLNRRGFLSAAVQLIAIAKREGAPVTLAYCDLDGLKDVNDELGHHAGDALLRSAARVLGGAIREADVAGRLGGDEFAVLFYGLDSDHVQLRHERLAEAIAEYNHHAGLGGPISLSIGYVQWNPPETVRDLLERADAAMYEVKSARRTVRA